MADSIRTLAELQTLLATNGQGGLSAQDIRDFLVSTWSIENVVSVGNSGQVDYNSLTDAITYANANATVTNPITIELNPGTYTVAPFSLSAYVTIAGKRAVIVPTDNNNPLITMATGSRITNCELTNPTSSIGIYATGAAIINSCRLSGGLTAISTGASGVAVVNFTSIISCTNGLFADNGGAIAFSHTACRNTTNALRLDNASTAEGIFSIEGTNTYSILQDDSASQVTITNASFSIDSLSITNWDNVKLAFNNIKEADESFAIIQELQVGTAEKGYESVMGEGDSYTRGMLVYTYDGASFVDVSAEAQSASGSTFTFPNTSVDTAIYVASSLNNSLDKLTHYGIKTNVNTAIVRGTGDVIAEYWTGSVWLQLDTMEVDSGGNYYPHGDVIFQDLGSHQVRYSCDLVTDSWTKNDPVTVGTDYYWVRYRISSAITTAPIFEQFKLHTNRFEVNADGFLEYFGTARPVGTLPWSIDNAKAWSSSPSDQDLYVYNSPTGEDYDIGMGRLENSFAANAIDKISICMAIPEDLDTSCPIKITVHWMGTSATAGNIAWKMSSGVLPIGAGVTTTVGDAPTTMLSNSEQVAVEAVGAGEDAILKRTVLSFTIPKGVARDATGGKDMLAVALISDGTDGTDTYPGARNIVNLKATYTKWCEGGHI